MELVELLRDVELLQSGRIKLLARRRRRLGVDLAMGRAPVMLLWLSLGALRRWFGSDWILGECARGIRDLYCDRND